MSTPHDAPSVAQLVEAVREWMERDVLPATDGRLKFHSRVAINMLSMVERELELADEHAVRHGVRLAALGVESDRDLADAVRRGDFDDRLGELKAALRSHVDDKLAVANPRYVDDDRRGDNVTS